MLNLTASKRVLNNGSDLGYIITKDSAVSLKARFYRTQGSFVLAPLRLCSSVISYLYHDQLPGVNEFGTCGTDETNN